MNDKRERGQTEDTIDVIAELERVDRFFDG